VTPAAERSPLVAAILAGGRGARFGGADKPLITVGGRRIVDRQIEVLATLSCEILIVGGRAEAFAGLGARLVPDLRPALGPLAGIEAALEASRADSVVVVAGDMPLIAPALLAELARAAPDASAVVPRVGGRAEPLCARYSARARGTIQARLDRGARSVKGLLDELDVAWLDEPALRALDPDLLSFCDVDGPADLARIEAHLRAR
jgi:molybdopterin-guanine dinucleotide biosynthesis protein A